MPDFLEEGFKLTAAAYNKVLARLAEVERSNQTLTAALENLLDMYVRLINSGDCGNWDPEADVDVQAARAALDQARGGA